MNPIINIDGDYYEQIQDNRRVHIKGRGKHNLKFDSLGFGDNWRKENNYESLDGAIRDLKRRCKHYSEDPNHYIVQQRLMKASQKIKYNILPAPGFQNYILEHVDTNLMQGHNDRPIRYKLYN